MSENYVTEISHRIYFCIGLLCLAVVTPILAYLGFLKPIDEPQVSWLQRSGSITVIIAIWVEFLLIKIQKYPVVTGFLIVNEPDPEHRYMRPYAVAVYATGFIALLGTAIWGYGDVILKLL